MKIDMPNDVKNIINNIQNNGYQAYIVGGCVRDTLLNKDPKDWDITTNCLPEKIIEIFKDYTVIPTGLKHGTVTIMINYIPFEITTFRIDGEYSDNRRPDDVIFTSNLKEDLSRRDFTINSMAYNDEEGLIDYFNGINDLNNKIIKCVGNPNDRFAEDALRMLRACRFACQLDFNIDLCLTQSIIDNAERIQNISFERISSEINKILLSDDPADILLLYNLHLLDHIIPSMKECFETNQDNPYHTYNVGRHILESVDSIENNLILRLTMLLHDIAKPLTKTIDENGIGHFYGHAEKSSEMVTEILKRLRYDNYTIMKVRDLIFNHDQEIADTKKSVRRWLNKIGEETFKDLLKVKEADIKAQNLEYYQERHDKLERIKIILEEVLDANECFSKKDLAINGTDLISLGFKQGKEIGEIIDKLVEIVIEQPELNNREELLKIVNTPTT